MSPHEQIAEEKIQEALARGEAENPPGKGQPLKHLDAYFATPEPLRL